MENNTNTTVKTARLEASELDIKISNATPALSFKDLFTIEQHNAMRNAYMKHFDEAWKGAVTCSNIATIRGVTTSAVVSFINHDLEHRTAHIAETIENIGSGKPKMSLADKLKKMGVSKAQLQAMLEQMED